MRRTGLALCAALISCALPDSTFLAYDGPRLPESEVARLEEEPRTEGYDIVGHGWTEIRMVDGQLVDVSFAVELLPGPHELIVDAAWQEPEVTDMRGAAKVSFAAEAGHHYVLRVQGRGLARLMVVILDEGDGRMVAWVPAD